MIVTSKRNFTIKKDSSLKLRPSGYRTATGINNLLKKGIWIYFILLIFEGALRKWILPQLATPLLVVRDPIAIWLIFTSWRYRLIPNNNYITWMIILGVISIFTSILFGHGNLWVTAFGARTLLIHFPLIFTIGRIFNYEDVLKLGKIVLWMSIPMTILIGAQFYSPQNSWINRGIGGDITGGGFSGALGYFRPPATFSFISGTVLFYGLAASFVFYFWLNQQNQNKLVLIASTICLISAIPLSISRSLFFSIILALLFAILGSLARPRFLGKMTVTVVVGVVVLTFLSNTSFFKTAFAAFSERFNTANEVEGGLQGVLVDRYLGGMVGALKNSSNQSFFGGGLGLGTNVGSMLLTGTTQFLISEGEWGRLIGEMGPLMGIGFILLRVGFCVKILDLSLRRLMEGYLLPWMLLYFALLTIPQGQWSQPTTQGFSTLAGGLVIAALKKPTSKK